MRTPLFVLLMVAMLPLGASAQATDAERRIEAAMQQARDAGVPVSLLQSKVDEGRAKNVEAGRIAAAVEQRLAFLLRANSAMRGVPNLSSADLGVGADALEVGVTEAVLNSLANEAPSNQRTVAIAVLAQLVRQGDSPEGALGDVRRAMQRGPQALQRLPAEAARQRRGRPEAAGNRGNSGQGAAAGSGANPGVGPPASTPAKGKPPGAGQPGRPQNPGRPDNPGKPNNPGKP